MRSAFGKIVGRDKLDVKTTTPKSASNASMEANRPSNAPYVHRTGRFLDSQMLARLKHVAHVQNSRVKRKLQHQPLDLSVFRGWCGGL